MAVRRSIDSLIREFAEIRGVTPDYAVRIAVTEALERERERIEEPEEEASYASTIEAIDARRLAIARCCGQDTAEDELCSEAGAPAALITIYLLGGAILARPLQLAILVFFLLCLVSMYFYWRRVRRKRESRKQMRESLALEIEELGKGLPERLRFLGGWPTLDLTGGPVF
jgi:hypothetical protein